MGATEQLAALASKAEDALARAGSTLVLEPYVVAALDLAKGNPDDRADLAGAFISLTTAGGPWEFVAACMHALRWTEVRVAIAGHLDEAIRRDDWRAIPVLRSVVEAFENEWEDADMFPWLPTPKEPVDGTAG